MSLISTVTITRLGLADALPCRRGASRPARRAAAGTASRPAPRGPRWPGAASAGGSAPPDSPRRTPAASLTKTASTSASIASGGSLPGHRDGLDRLALGDHAEQLLLGGSEPAGRDDRPDQRLDDGGIERGAAGGHRCGSRRPAGCPRRPGPSAGSHSRPSPRPAARPRTPGSSYCDSTTTPVPGWRLRTSLAASMPSRLERRRHPDVGDQDLRLGGGDAADHLVVVGGHADHPQVGVPLDERAHSLADDQVVVREEDVDGALGERRRWPHASVVAHLTGDRPVSSHQEALVVVGTPGQASHHPGFVAWRRRRSAHAIRELHHLSVLDSLRSGHRRDAGWPSTAGSPTTTIRRPADRRHRGAAGRGQVPVRQRAARPGSRSTARARSPAPAMTAAG